MHTQSDTERVLLQARFHKGVSRLRGWRCIITARWIRTDSLTVFLWFLHQLFCLPSLSWYAEFIVDVKDFGKIGHNHEMERLPSFGGLIDLTTRGARFIEIGVVL